MRKLAAEALGTFALVFAGTGAIVADDISGGVVIHVEVALSFGLVVLAMIYAVGDVSECHPNPAITLGFFAARRFPGGSIPPYVLAQCLGAGVASVLMMALFPGHRTLGATRPGGTAVQSFVMEAVLSLILMFVILSVSSGSKKRGCWPGWRSGRSSPWKPCSVAPSPGPA